MKVTGSSVLHAPPERVWGAITDPDVLAQVIPGCEGLVPVTPDRFRLAVTLGVASIKGTYAGEVSFADQVAPRSLTLRASGAGAPGTIDTTVAVTLTDLGDALTRVDYDAEAIVGGMVGGVGQRVLGAVARRTADAFFAAVDRALVPAAAAPAQIPAAPAGAPAALPAPAYATVAPPRRAGAWELTAAAAVGASSMLIGVLVGVRIGARLGRRSDRP